MIIHLKDGRKLSYEEYGDKGGTPVILLHGTPGSRIWFVDDDPVSREMGIRCICPERPGYGHTDFSPDHSFSSYPGDIQQLADQLELQEFYLLGVSGGGAFAAACAHFLGNRVKRSSIVSSTCPPSMLVDKRCMSSANRIAFWLAENFSPGLMALTALSRKLILSRPERYLKEIKPQLCKWDQRVFETPSFQKLAIVHLQEAYKQGVRGAVHELKLQTRDWGFELQSIGGQVQVWHGQEDTLAPHSMGQAFARGIKNATFHSIPGAGHLLTDDTERRKEILEDLLSP